MRTPRVLTVVAAGLLVVAACSDDDGAATATTASSAAPTAPATTGPPVVVDMPTVTGEWGEKPDVSIPLGQPNPSDVQVEVVIEGDGPPVAAGDQMTVKYVGLLWRDNDVFDATWDRGDETMTFPIGTGEMLVGWDEGLVGVPYGSRVVLVIPPDKAFGREGRHESGIFDDDAVVYVVDVIEKAA